MKTRIRFVTVLVLFGAVGCSMLPLSESPSSVHIDRLYFGRSIGAIETVSDSSWSTFLREVVTPLFPNGFSVWRGEGQWKGSDGTIVREESFILEIIHPIDVTEADAAIEQIAAEYKRQFHQEAVLRVTTSGRARF
jgi:hypothetical protein